MNDEVPAWALEMLAAARVARLATADGAARPLVVPVCYAFDGERVYSAVDAKPKRTRQLRRLANIAANPRVALLVDEYHEDWTRLRYVLVEGRADVLTPGTDQAWALDLLRAKYLQYGAGGVLDADAPVVRITPEHWVTWRSAA